MSEKENLALAKVVFCADCAHMRRKNLLDRNPVCVAFYDAVLGDPVQILCREARLTHLPSNVVRLFYDPAAPLTATMGCVSVGSLFTPRESGDA